ncbi:MAG: gliding motility-associated C-terminal domain-containing protein, partial [Bacteroidia bacterium]
NDCFHPALQLAPPPQDRAFLECTDLYVYNRWGELVHSSVNDNEPCWSGTNLNGDDLPEGVYFYRFDAFGEERAGVVHLRRAKL